MRARKRSIDVWLKALYRAMGGKWSGRRDFNQRPPVPQAGAVLKSLSIFANGFFERPAINGLESGLWRIEILNTRWYFGS
jgi:hypothetical protein